jgi:hypothetical protein
MNSETIVGILFVVVAVTAIAGLGRCNPLLKSCVLLGEGSQKKHQIIFGTIFKLILYVFGRTQRVLQERLQRRWEYGAINGSQNL